MSVAIENLEKSNSQLIINHGAFKKSKTYSFFILINL